MAVFISGVSECSICHNILCDKDDRVAMSMFINDKSNKFWPYSDSNMHRKCFLEWEPRSEFIKIFNSSQTRYIMTENGTLVKRKKWWNKIF